MNEQAEFLSVQDSPDPVYSQPEGTDKPDIIADDSLSTRDTSDPAHSQTAGTDDPETKESESNSKAPDSNSNSENSSEFDPSEKIERLHISEWYRRAKLFYGPLSSERSRYSTIDQGVGIHIVTAYYQDVPGDTNFEPESPELLSSRASKDVSTGPLRLVISSELLVRELQDISNVYLHQRPLALIHPFKLLIHNWDGIKSRLQTLEEMRQLSQTSHTHLHVPSSRLTGNANVRIQHLQCLHDFIQTDLAYLIHLQEQIQNGTLHDVSFDELYFLFSPGDLIFSSKTGIDQLYRVYWVSGGRIRLQVPRERDRENNEAVGTWTDVQVECFTIFWDGKQLGPFEIIRRIQHFTGRRAITDLEVYPLRYAENAQEIRESLQLRGRKYLECSGHRKYSGLTMQPHWILETFRVGLHDVMFGPSSISAEKYAKMKASAAEVREVNSDVYIDYQQGYSYNFDSLYELETLPGSYGESGEVNETISASHHMDISYASGDHDVDVSRSNKFLLNNWHLVKPSKPAEDLVDEEFRFELLPPCALAFDFKSRKWGKYWWPPLSAWLLYVLRHHLQSG